MSDRARVKKSRRQPKRTKSVHFNIPRSEYYSVPPVSPRPNRTKWNMKCVFSNIFGVVGVIVVGSLIIGSFQFGWGSINKRCGKCNSWNEAFIQSKGQNLQVTIMTRWTLLTIQASRMKLKITWLQKKIAIGQKFQKCQVFIHCPTKTRVSSSLYLRYKWR